MATTTTEAVENGVVNYDGLTGLVIQTGENGHTEVWLGLDLGKAFTLTSFEAMLPSVKERIEAGKKPAGYLSKALNRAYHHRAHLQDALMNLCETYSNMTAFPVSKVSAVWKARYSMLDGMSNKVLKMYAADYLPDEVDNYILSDAADKVTLITKLATILAEEKEDKTEEKEGESAVTV